MVSDHGRGLRRPALLSVILQTWTQLHYVLVPATSAVVLLDEEGAGYRLRVAPLDVEREMLAQFGAELMVAEPGGAAELVSLAPDADAVLTNWRDVPPGVLDAAPRCVIVSRYGIGVDNIPVERATQLGILVTNVPGFCIDEVGDHALALVPSCARRIVSFDRATSGGTWNLSAIAPGMRRLRGQTLGLVGFGQLGQALAGKAVPLGLQVLAYTPRLPTGPISPGIDGTDDFESLLRQSDYVSLHAPSTPATYHMINETALRLMKPTAYLINTSRAHWLTRRPWSTRATTLDRGRSPGRDGK